MSVDLIPTVRRRLRTAATRRRVTVKQYVLSAIEDCLREDLGDEAEGVLTLTAEADPVLAALWNNRRDAHYDRM